MDKTQVFTIGGAISNGWELTKAKYGTVIKLFLTVFGVQIGIWIIQAALGSSSDSGVGALLGIVVGLAAWLLMMFLQLNLTKAAVRLVDGAQVVVRDLFDINWGMLGSYILATILYGLMFVGVIMLAGILGALGFGASALVGGTGDASPILAIIGFLLVTAAVIAVIYFALGLSQYMYLIVDKDAGPVESLKGSWAITKGLRLRIFLLLIVLMFLNLGGALLFLVGLLVTIPLSWFAMVWVYRQLSQAYIPSAMTAAPVKAEAKPTPEKKTAKKKA